MLHGLLWFLSFIAFRTQVLPGPSNQTSGVTTAAAQPGDGGSQLPETAAVAGEARMLSRNISGFKWLQKAPTVGRCWCKCWCRCWYITAVGLVFLVFGSLWHRCFRRLLRIQESREETKETLAVNPSPKRKMHYALSIRVAFQSPRRLRAHTKKWLILINDCNARFVDISTKFLPWFLLFFAPGLCSSVG